MNYSIMEALFDGRVIPWERRCPMSDRRRDVEEKIQEEKQYIMERLSADDHKRLERLENLYGDAAHDEEINTYSHGFALGALLMLEVMEKKSEMVSR